MREYHSELRPGVVYINGPITIYFDGNDRFSVVDKNIERDYFHHPDVISMQHARDIAERYMARKRQKGPNYDDFVHKYTENVIKSLKLDRNSGGKYDSAEE